MEDCVACFQMTDCVVNSSGLLSMLGRYLCHLSCNYSLLCLCLYFLECFDTRVTWKVYFNVYIVHM